MTTANRVKAMIADHLNVDLARVVPAANFRDDLNADSLDHVELTMAFETEFLIEIPDDDAELILTVADAVKAVERRAGIGG
jgi:acyl carrier protein